MSIDLYGPTMKTGDEKTFEVANPHLIFSNSVYSLVGQLLPLVVALVSLPFVIKGFGKERFGMLTLAWVLVGYFNIFNLGIGRALTKLVADRLGTSESSDLPSLIWTALGLLTLLGIVGGIAFAAVAPHVVSHVLNISPELQSETLKSFYLLCIAIPIVVSSSGLRGILEAYQRFDLVNLVRIPMGIFVFLSPLMVLPFSHSLVALVGILAVARAAAWIAFAWLSFRIVPTLRTSITLSVTATRSLFALGAWMTVSNIVSPFLIYMDRFMIAGVFSGSVLAYYTTPFEIVTKLEIIPMAAATALFPVFAGTFSRSPARTAQIYGRSMIYVFAILFPLVILVIGFAREGLFLWLGPDFAANSSVVLQWLAAGMLFNSVARIPSGFLQGSGRPDLTAKLHLIETPLYIFLLWWSMNRFGIQGVAISWFIRVAMDMIFLLIASSHVLPGAKPAILKTVYMLAGSVPFLYLAGSIIGSASKCIFLSGVFMSFAFIAWRRVLLPDEKAFIMHRLDALRLAIAGRKYR